jgi:hypothetical protein
LAIEHKVLEVNIIVQDVKQSIDEVDEFQPELLKSLIPFAIPVCV